MLYPLYAQIETPWEVGISTDPRAGAAFNNEGGPVNTFDWFSGSTLSPHALYGPYLAQPPFVNPFYNNNPDLNYLAFQAESDFYPEDGWELIQWGFGMRVDGTTEQSVSGFTRQKPILILYNRHTAMLHIFGAYNDFTSEIFETQLRFTYGTDMKVPDPGRGNYKLSALLSQASEVAQPLDQPTTVTDVASQFRFPNSNTEFVHAAFPIAYDPCVSKNYTKGSRIFTYTR
ncbi:MAG: hypothetical protein AAF135_09815, partial [Bacteroidota bacterium]